MEIHIRFSLDAPRGWARRVGIYVVAPVALVAAVSAVAWGYDTAWIKSGDPLSAAKLKSDLDEIQTRLDDLEKQEPVQRSTVNADGSIKSQAGSWITIDVNNMHNPGSGSYGLLFSAGVFTDTPTCVATANAGNAAPPIVECYNIDKNGITCQVATSSGAPVDTGLFLICVGP